jgi:protein involved in polysaccharide export with SLBB domain
MRRITIGEIILFLSFLCLVSCAHVEEPVNTAEGPYPQATDPRAVYTVGMGDVLTVRLREGVEIKEFDATVMSTGTIVVSFIEIEAAGFTINEIRDKARQELGKYLRDFSVDLIVREWREKKIFVLGEVKNPGVYNFSAGMTTLQALVLSGGYKNTAVLNDMRIIRGDLDNPQLIQVDLKRAFEGRGSKDVLLAQNDVIYVPRSTIGDWNNFINLYIRPTIEVLSLPLGTASTVKGLAE